MLFYAAIFANSNSDTIPEEAIVGLGASQTLERLWRQNFLRGLEISASGSDIVVFTPLTERTGPTVLVAAQVSFSPASTRSPKEGVEKIKAIGDGYMAAAGVPEPHPDGPRCNRPACAGNPRGRGDAHGVGQ